MPSQCTGTTQGTGTIGNKGTYRQLLRQRVPAEPSDSNGTIEGSGTIQPALWGAPHLSQMFLALMSKISDMSETVVRVDGAVVLRVGLASMNIVNTPEISGFY